MGNISTIYQRFHGDICRRCINETYRVNLTPNDCFYGAPFPQLCPNCNTMQNLVSALRLTGKIKLLFR